MPRICSWNVNGLQPLEKRLPIHIPDKNNIIDLTNINDNNNDNNTATTTTTSNVSQLVDISTLYNDVTYFSAMQKCLIHPKQRTIKVHTLQQLFDSLYSDIICIQEHKLVSKHDLSLSYACIEGYNSYWTFNNNNNRKHAYSGCVTYTRKSTVNVISAEQGFTGLLCDKQTSIYGCTELLYTHYSMQELRELDSEGRCVICNIDNKFLLFNVYLPNASDDIRDDFKLRYYNALQLRLELLIRAGYNVIVCGDVNTAHKRIDHCDYSNVSMKKQNNNDDNDIFEEKPSRIWLDNMMVPNGHFIDLYRYYYPNKQYAYTVWNTLTSARLGNYGTRIDYFLVTQNLVDNDIFINCDIWSDVAGSDHCPVVCDIHIPFKNDENNHNNGKVIDSSILGSNIMQCNGLQSTLKSWFNIQHNKNNKLTTTTIANDATDTDNIQYIDSVFDINDNNSISTANNYNNNTVEQQSAFNKRTASNIIPSKSSNKKQKKTDNNKQQNTLLSFFAKPATSITNINNNTNNSNNNNRNNNTLIATTASNDDTINETTTTQSSNSSNNNNTTTDNERYIEQELQYTTTYNTTETQQQWSSLFNKKKNLVLLCKGHNLPCKLYKTNKKGPNHNREFYCCSIPVPDRCKTWLWKSAADKYMIHRHDTSSNNNNISKGIVAPD